MTADPLRDPVTGGSKPKAEEEKKRLWVEKTEELEDALRSSWPEISVARGGAIYGGAIYGGVRFDETLPSRDFITITRAAEEVRRGRVSEAEWWDLVYRVARMRLITEAELREVREAREARETPAAPVAPAATSGAGMITSAERWVDFIHRRRGEAAHKLGLEPEDTAEDEPEPDLADWERKLLETDAAEAEAKEAREDESVLMRITREATADAADAAVEGVSWGDIRRRKPPMPERWDELDPPSAGAAGRMTMPSEVDMDRMMREALARDWPPELFPSRITVGSSTPARLIDEFPDWMMRPTEAANPSPPDLPDLAPSAWSMNPRSIIPGPALDFRGQPRKGKKSRKKRN